MIVISCGTGLFCPASYRLHEGDQLHPPYANELDFYGDTNCWSATTG